MLSLSKMCQRDKSIPKISRVRQRQSMVQHQAVRRNLFGPVNHQSTEKFLNKELDEIIASCKKDWDFDFSCEAPLPSTRFVWEPLHRPEGLVRVTGRGQQEGKHLLVESNKLIKDLSQDSIKLSTGENGGTKRPCRAKSGKKRTKMVTFGTTETSKSPKSLIQPTIKSYLPIRKRRSLKCKDTVMVAVVRPKRFYCGTTRVLRRSRCEKRSVEKRR